MYDENKDPNMLYGRSTKSSVAVGEVLKAQNYSGMAD
jgi:hypothetical protein